MEDRIMTLQSHLSSLILAPIESVYETSYWSSIVTLVLSCRVSEILDHFYAESRFSIPSPIAAKISGCSPWSRSVVFGSAESELTAKLFSMNSNQCDNNPPTLQTDRRLSRGNIPRYARYARTCFAR